MNKKKNKLTKLEERLLMYPPNENTWICNKCKFIVTGNFKNCNWCLEPKPENPKLIYKTYLTACEKVGIIPGSCRWKYREGSKVPIVFLKDGTKWIEQNELKEEISGS